MAGHKKQKPQEPEAPRPPAADSVGETLRAAREASRLEIDTVAKALHIRTTQIKAIEESNIEALPGMTYAVGFVRSYANYLGLNGADIVHRFKAEQGHDPAQSKLSFPQPIAESRVPDPMMVGVGAFLAVVILVLWTVYSNMHGGGAKTADKIPPAPVVTSVADSMPTTTTPAATTTAPAATPPLAGATTTPATSADQSATPAITMPSSATVPAPEAQTAALAVVAATTPAVTAPAAPVTKARAKIAADADANSDDQNADDSDNAPVARKTHKTKRDDDDGVIKISKGKSRITLKATAPSWIQIVDARQNVLYRKVLRPGETYSVPDQPGLILDTANAGALKIVVDGKVVLPLGKNGDILRGVALDPQSLKGARLRD